MSGSGKHAARIEHRQAIRDAAERLLRHRRDPHVEVGDILLACVGAQGALELLEEIEQEVVLLRDEVARLREPMLRVLRHPASAAGGETIDMLTDDELDDLWDDTLEHYFEEGLRRTFSTHGVYRLVGEIMQRRARERGDGPVSTDYRRGEDEKPMAYRRVVDIAQIPLPGRPSATIEGLTDEELGDVYQNVEDDEIPASWIRALVAEIVARRALERAQR